MCIWKCISTSPGKIEGILEKSREKLEPVWVFDLVSRGLYVTNICCENIDICVKMRNSLSYLIPCGDET